MNPVGRQWFPLTLTDPGEYWRGVVAARPALDAFLDAELARHGLGDDRLALVGFSQGTMMALHVGPRRQHAPAAIVGYSGLLAGPEHLAGTAARPPVLLIHGDADELIPPVATEMAARALGAADFLVEWHISRGLGHGIDEAGLTRGGQFLATALAAKKA
jgi:phospholipase/carboxylesterase